MRDRRRGRSSASAVTNCTVKVITVTADELFIPRGVTHRLSAPVNGGRILEVAFGDFDANDIERLDDIYGRTTD